MGQCPCHRSSTILDVLLPSRKAQSGPILRDAKGWRCSTRNSLPLGDAVAPEHTKRDMSPSRGTEFGLQTYRSSRRVHSVWGFESPTISMGSASELELARWRTILFLCFFQAYRGNFECDDRRNEMMPKEVQAKHPRASSVTNTVD